MSVMESDDEELNWQEMYDVEVLDVTESVQNYEKGKALKCPNCGQGIGLPYGEQTWRCETCKKMHLDKECGEREPPKREQGQAGLTDFL